MIDLLPQVGLGYVGNNRRAGNAVARILPKADFATALEEITVWPGYEPTPLVSLGALASRLSVSEIVYKHEGPRFGLGSFKALGGSYAGLRAVQRQLSERLGREIALADIRNGAYRSECADIVLASATDGNHGRSLAWGCRRFGASCRIYIHAEVSEGRAEAMRALGAEVVRVDGDYDASLATAKSEADEHGWLLVSDTSWPGYANSPKDAMAGYGVMTNEIFRTLAEPPSHVFLQGGCGGLAASCVAAFKHEWGDRAPRAVIVEPDLAPCLFASAKRGAATTIEITEETAMAGLSCGEPSDLAWQILAEEASDFLTIPDMLVAPTMRLLARPLNGDPAIEAGESAIAGLAALIATRQSGELSEKLGLREESCVLLIGSEGVTDRAIFEQIVSQSD